MFMRPVTRRWARLGEWDPRELFHPSDAGVCLSVFLVAKRGNSILVGRVRGTRDWPEKGGFPRYRAIQLEHTNAWLLPATHLMMEESPDHAAKRIAREWGGLTGVPKFLTIQSHIRPSTQVRRGGKGNHWDLCFVYELKAAKSPKPRPWWSEMRFVPRSQIGKLKMGRGHLDILKEAGYA